MEQKNVQAQLQLQDSFVKEFNLQTIKKFNAKENLKINGQLGFKMNSINEKENIFKGEIELINDLKVVCKGEECSNIHIVMVGIFTATKDNKYDKNCFEEMLKLNGATTLSYLIRAYIYSVTGLSGIPQITTPLINFKEFFENAKEVKSSE